MKITNAEQTVSPGRRAATYWFADGLEEIAFGLLFFISGAAGLLFSHWSHRWLGLVILIFFIGLWILLCADRPIIESFKARLTYPRTGYARPPDNPEPDQDILVDFLLPATRRRAPLTLWTARAVDENVTSFKARTVYVLLAASVATELGKGGRWSTATILVVTALFVFVLNRGEVRAYSFWTVFPMALAGLLSAAVELPSQSRQLLPLVIGGGWLLWIGSWTLVRYLRAHSKPDIGREGRS